MVFGLFNERRRERLRAEQFPATWRAILERNLAFFRRLSDDDRAELLGHTQVFLAEKHFEGCGGLELSDEIRVTIAAQACLLLLHRKTDYYPELTSILVYPTGYTADEVRHIGGGVCEDGPEDRLGHTASHLGALVLAWDAARHGAADPSDGENVVLHEFAHQLDFENRNADGTPVLETHAEYLAWARVMSAEFNELRRAEAVGAPTLLDGYGATNPTEFFAVAPDAPFARPRALRARHPQVGTGLEKVCGGDAVIFSSGPAG